MPGGTYSTEARSDSELLRAHVSGDSFAFAELISRHQRSLWLLAVRTSYSTEDAADSLQEALLSAHRMSQSFRFDAKVSTWLHRIVVNACLDRRRRNRIQPAIPIGDPDAMQSPDARDETALVDLSVSIGRALLKLPEDQRAVIVALDVHGMSMAETSDMLGISVGTVKSRSSRGRVRLARALGHLREFY